MKKEHLERLKTLLKSLKINPLESKPVKSIAVAKPNEQTPDVLEFQIDDVSISAHGSHRVVAPQKLQEFVDLDHQRNVLAAMIQTIAVGDVCLIGRKHLKKSQTFCDHFFSLRSKGCRKDDAHKSFGTLTESVGGDIDTL